MGQLLRVVVLTFLLCSPIAAQRGAIELFVGETLFKRGTRVSATFLHEEGGGLLSGSSSTPNPNGLERSRDILVLGITHGLRRGTDLTLLVPIVHTDATFLRGTRSIGTDRSALGDISLTVRQRVHHELWERSAWATSILGGVQSPTGKDDERQNGMLLPPSLQAGSGSFDPFVGIASTLELDRLRIDGSLFYLRPTEGAQDYEGGDVFSASLTAGYRVLMTRYPGPTVGVKAGLRYRHEGRARLDGLSLDSSGREELALQFGVTCHPSPEWDFITTLEVPVHENVGGSQLGVGYRLLFGVGWRF